MCDFQFPASRIAGGGGNARLQIRTRFYETTRGPGKGVAESFGSTRFGPPRPRDCPSSAPRSETAAEDHLMMSPSGGSGENMRPPRS